MENQSQSDFLKQVHDSYGSTQELAKVLDLGIEMLFYLEENAFSQREVQNVVSAMRDLTKTLRENKD